MLLLDNYHLVGHCLLYDERGFGSLELIIQQGESDDIFGLQHVCRLGWPNQDLKTALPEGASWGSISVEFTKHYNTCPILLTFGAHVRHLLYQPVVETLGGLLHLGGHYPHLCPKQKHIFNQRHTKYSRRSPIRSLPPQNVSIRLHFPHARRRFCSNTGQSSSEDKKFRPKYLNKRTVISSVPYDKKNTPSR